MLLGAKLVGYNFQCDVKQLAHSYVDLGCFKQYQMLLDIQNVFKEPRGGLSGLSEVIIILARKYFSLKFLVFFRTSFYFFFLRELVLALHLNFPNYSLFFFSRYDMMINE